MKTTSLVMILGLSLALISCVKPKDYPIEPKIEYIGFNKLTILQGGPNAPNDTLFLRLGFTDGDGDLGNDDSAIDIFITDSRTPRFQEIRKLPVIPEEGVGNGISGEIILRFPNKIDQICCLEGEEACAGPIEGVPSETFSYQIQIRDRAGNLSNAVRTETVTILCE
ncbi:hypothetical protein [Phaeodactylibacter sp.]|uniref:hypothetical protein n=1 Tax=Phaeodactylibacter sp. TaxID=1940289 RepID=UPI0025EFBC41|nr:hypothetical protein [Phaeodactylibacter sp.]MCI4647795.1 hypothetical protein [Phaeodactylibacter sp.]MCI5090511.1 hypothetical protein [Phaeodactylibacter sp.]